MLFIWRTILIFIVYSLLAHSTIAKATKLPSFSSAEHMLFGDEVKVFFSLNDPGQMSYLFHFPNGLSLTYGEILAFGDFHGIPHRPISFGPTAPQRKIRFRQIFDSLTQDPNIAREAKHILDVIRVEKKILIEGMKNGQTPEEVYHRIGDEFDRQLNCITGGGCAPDSWWMTPGRYLILLQDNYDHFGNNAWLAYQAGHEVAMEEALIASQTGDRHKLELAYAMNAFACHFLSDQFSAGHIRTPRQELPQHVTPDVVGSLLAEFMHDEENRFGIHVHNKRGDRWMAYGDKSYFNPNNAMNRQILTEILQISLNHIFAVYQQGTIHVKENVSDIIPEADELKNLAIKDISSLFYWDNSYHLLMRRNSIANPYDRHWTSDWWGWSTLTELQQHKRLSLLSQVALAQSEYSNQAIKDGLITNEHIIQYINAKPSSS